MAAADFLVYINGQRADVDNALNEPRFAMKDDHQNLPTSVDIPGAKRTDFPDGSHLIEGPDGERYLVSESGEINATVPEIRRVQIADLSLILRHEIAHVHETTSHTLHFVGGGVFSYLHQRGGPGMSIHANRIVFRTLPGGAIVVCGSAPSNAPGRAPSATR